MLLKPLFCLDPRMRNSLRSKARLPGSTAINLFITSLCKHWHSCTGSPLRDVLSSIILKLNEMQILLELYNKWWKVDDNKCKLQESEGANIQLELKNLRKCMLELLHSMKLSALVCSIFACKTKSFKQRRPHEHVHCRSSLHFYTVNYTKFTYRVFACQ